MCAYIYITIHWNATARRHRPSLDPPQSNIILTLHPLYNLQTLYIADARATLPYALSSSVQLHFGISTISLLCKHRQPKQVKINLKRIANFPKANVFGIMGDWYRVLGLAYIPTLRIRRRENVYLHCFSFIYSVLCVWTALQQLQTILSGWFSTHCYKRRTLQWSISLHTNLKCDKRYVWLIGI